MLTRRSSRVTEQPHAAHTPPAHSTPRGRSSKKQRRQQQQESTPQSLSQPARKWVCHTCTLENESTSMDCAACGSRRVHDTDDRWTCKACTYVHSDMKAQECEVCGKKRESSDDKQDNHDSTDCIVLSDSHSTGVSSSSPALSRALLPRETAVFRMCVEEYFKLPFDTINTDVIRGIERLIVQPWNALKALQPPTSSFSSPTSSSSAHSARNNLNQPTNDRQLAPSFYLCLQKALVQDGCRRAVAVCRNLDVLYGCCKQLNTFNSNLACLGCGMYGHERLLQYSEQCVDLHPYCLLCLHNYIKQRIDGKDVSRLTCPYPACQTELDVLRIRRCLSVKEFNEYSNLVFESSLTDDKYVRCPNNNCGNVMEVIEAQPWQLEIPHRITETDSNGKVISAHAWLHFKQNRYRCNTCQQNFCRLCKVSPYHLGQTCDEHQSYLTSQHCRFCQEQLTDDITDKTERITALQAICTAEECQERKKTVCTHMHQCGHPCNGVRDESVHLPCLEAECAEKSNLNVNASDYCGICWSESLGAAPCVQLSSCSHIFHQHCVIEKIRKSHPGVRLTFGFLECPMCKEMISHPSPPIQHVLKPAMQLYTRISEKARMRLQMEKREKDTKLTDPNSPFYNKPLQYALAIFAYYPCFKCKQEYFGGLRDCEQNALAENRPMDEFVCYSCSDLKSAKCNKPEHAEYLLWKCRYCCSLAAWFCFGTTHFCDPCHTKLSQKPVTKCSGGAKCPLQLASHSPNGTGAESEHCLGCGVCSEQLHNLTTERKKEEEMERRMQERRALAGGQEEKEDVEMKSAQV